jgi:hypothetical protein
MQQSERGRRERLFGNLLDGDPMNNENTSAQEEVVRLLEAAIAEFKLHGRVANTRCNKCHELICVKKAGDEAFTVSCPCGQFWGAIRGI